MGSPLQNYEFFKQKSNIPARFFGKTLENYKQNDKTKKESLSAILGNQSVTLVGNPGTGKTHLAIGLLWEFWQHCVKLNPFDQVVYSTMPLFVTMPDLLMEIRGTYREASPLDESDVLRKYCHRGILLVDDLGTEKITEWTREVVYKIFNSYYLNCKPMIVTSNMSLDKLAEEIDDRIPSRLIEMGIVIELTGKDRRLRK